MSSSNPTGSLPLAEGKTKVIWLLDDEHVRIVSKDDLTAGDGKKHDVIEGKAKYANQTTCNVFRFLQACGLPVAFVKQTGDTEFMAERCEMIPYEVVCRGEAHGSILQRDLSLAKGHVFSEHKLEFFLKTSGKKWKEYDLPVDDPLIIFEKNRALLYRPDQPVAEQKPLVTLLDFPLQGSKDMGLVGQIALHTFSVLKKAWQNLSRTLADFKVEFGYNTKGELRLADVIDNDSWRVLEDGKYIDKQIYREGAGLDEVTEKYKLVAELTGFAPAIVISRALPKVVTPFFLALTLHLSNKMVKLMKRMAER